MRNCEFLKDCIKAPIRQRCVNYCLQHILLATTEEEQQLIMGLDKEMASSISAAFNDGRVTTFEELSLELGNDRIDVLIEKFLAINQFQLNYLNKTRNERDEIIEAIRRLDLDVDRDNDLLMSIGR